MNAVAHLRTWKKVENPTQFRKYETKEEKVVKFEANSLSEAELYLYDNYPAHWLVGFSLWLDNKNFAMHAVPEYWMEILGDKATPRNIVKELRKQALKKIADDEAIAKGLKKWVEDPYSGDYYLVDIK